MCRRTNWSRCWIKSPPWCSNFSSIARCPCVYTTKTKGRAKSSIAHMASMSRRRWGCFPTEKWAGGSERNQKTLAEVNGRQSSLKNTHRKSLRAEQGKSLLGSFAVLIQFCILFYATQSFQKGIIETKANCSQSLSLAEMSNLWARW